MIFKKIEADLQQPESEQVRFERVLDTLYASYRKVYLSQIEHHINRLNVADDAKQSLLDTASNSMNAFKQKTDRLSLEQKADLAIKTSAYELDTQLIKASERYLIEHFSQHPPHTDLKAVLTSKASNDPVHATAIAFVETTSRYKAVFDKAQKTFLDSLEPAPAMQHKTRNKTKIKP